MRFNGKKDLWLTIFIWASMLIGLGASVYPLFAGFFSVLLLVINLLLIIVILFIFWIYIDNYIFLYDDYIYVRFGPLREKILYEDLTKVKETHLLLSSLALSLDRIALYKKGSLKSLIAVQDKETFFKVLKQKSEHTLIVRKNKN
jgi:hypothetical protein